MRLVNCQKLNLWISEIVLCSFCAFFVFSALKCYTFMLCASIQVMASIGSTVTSVQLMTVTLSLTTHLMTQALDLVSCLNDVISSSLFSSHLLQDL